MSHEINALKPGLSKELKEHHEQIGDQAKVISTPVDEDEIRDFQRKIQTLTPEEWFRRIGPPERGWDHENRD